MKEINEEVAPLKNNTKATKSPKPQIGTIITRLYFHKKFKKFKNKRINKAFKFSLLLKIKTKDDRTQIKI